MNIASLTLDPPYTSAAISALADFVSAHDTPCTAAELVRLEQLAGALGDSTAAADLAARLEPARSDAGCWLRGAVLEGCGRFADAAAALRSLRDKTVGEERALVMLASSRNLFAAGKLDEIWHPLAEACKASAVPRTLRNAARLLAQARKRAETPHRRRCRLALLSSTT